MSAKAGEQNKDRQLRGNGFGDAVLAAGEEYRQSVMKFDCHIINSRPPKTAAKAHTPRASSI